MGPIEQLALMSTADDRAKRYNRDFSQHVLHCEKCRDTMVRIGRIDETCMRGKWLLQKYEYALRHRSSGLPRTR